MTATTLPTPVQWHRPLLVLAVATVALALACFLGMLVDDRQLLGVNVWEKPLKFAISGAIYAVTWSWLIGQLTRFRRVAWWAGTVSVILLAVELVVIVGAAAAGITSHFNVATPLNVALWAVMAFSISTLWVATFVVSILLFRNDLGDPARAVAIRAGAVIALVGMALAFLMTGPQGSQISDYQGVIGAHAVGVADGGPGIPLLGWSTVGGDLRIPHFVGMHALQVIPLALIAIELLARRVPRLAGVAVRQRLMLVIAGTYVVTVAVLTWQALRGQSIVHPDAATLALAAGIAVATVAAALVILMRPASAPANVPTERVAA